MEKYKIIKEGCSVAQHPDLSLVFLALARFAPAAHLPLQDLLSLLADIREGERGGRQVGSFKQICLRDWHNEVIDRVLFHLLSLPAVDLILLQALLLILKQELIVREGLWLFLALLVLEKRGGQSLSNFGANFENFFIFWGGLYKFQRICRGQLS